MATVDDWNKISQAPEFQGLDQGMKVQVRDRFFEKHIAPNAPQELLSEIKVKFDERTGLQPRTSNLGAQPVPESNMLRGAVERSSNVVGNLLSTGDTISRSLEESMPLGGFAVKEGDILPSYMNGTEFKEYSESNNTKQPLEVAGDYLKKAKVGYVPNHTWEKVKEEFSNDAFSGDAWKEVVLYATEQGVKSIPDMAASILSLPLYVTARSGEIGEARAKNKGKDKAEMEDILEAAPAALGSALLERFGAKGITKAGSEVLGKEAIKAGFAKMAKRVAVAGGVAGGKEAVTEFFQEGVVEYIGERLGTDAKMSVIEALDRGAAGAVAGGIYGGGAGTTVAATKEVIQLNKPGGYDLDEVIQESKPESQPSEAPQATDQQSSNLTGSNLQWTDTSNIAAQSQENLQKDYNGPGSFDPNQAATQNGQTPAEQQWTDTSDISPAAMTDLQSNYKTPERPDIQGSSNLIPLEGEVMPGALPGTPQIGFADRPDFVVNPEGEAAGQAENNIVEDIPALPYQPDSTVYADSNGGFVDRADIDQARVEQGNEQRETFVAEQEEKQNNPGGRGFYDQVERGATQEELSEYESLFLVADEIGSKESLEISEALEYGEITPEQAQVELDSLQQPELEQAQEDSGAVDIDALANEAATSPTNELSEPTDGQKEAGNYKKGRIDVHGMAIAIENPKGSKRSGTDPDGTAWENEIHSHYGDLTGTKGADGDALDVFVGENPDSQKVWVIDQLNKDGSFDEHKIMLGFTHKAKAIAGYKKNYNRGWKVGPVTAMSVDEFKSWVKEADTTKPISKELSKPVQVKKKEKENSATIAASSPVANPPTKSKAEEVAPEQSAEPTAKRGEERTEAKTTKPKRVVKDFGEVLPFAKKHNTFTEVDFNSSPEKTTLSKAWPEPKYKDLVADGLPVGSAAYLKALRDSIPSKPRNKRRLSRWLETVKSVSTVSREIIETKGAVDHKKRLAEALGLSASDLERYYGATLVDSKQIDEQAELDVKLGFPELPHANGHSISSGSYSYLDGAEHNPPITKYSIKKKGREVQTSEGKHFDEYDSAFQALKGIVADNGSTEKKVKFDIWKLYAKDGIVVGKKVGSKKYINLKTGFETWAEAKNYVRNNQNELESMLKKAKEIQDSRRNKNSLRTGEDYRNGKDVTEELFTETFGFNGVQFGNWVSNKRRIADLNEGYDALVDLANLINIPTQAISLNGQLGLAFGARGKGKASAHYEPLVVVINLTKKNGAGSLAHEWWHALDNYFGKMRLDGADNISVEEYIESFLTEGAPKRSIRKNGEWVTADGVRQEVVDQFIGVSRAIGKTSLPARSKILDGRRIKDYWGKVLEMTARSFESYVIQKLDDKGLSNDYLANVVEESEYSEASAYPYIKEDERTTVFSAYDELFRTLKTKKTKKGVALFSQKKKPKHAVESLAERRVLKERVNKEFKKHQEQVETWLAPTTLKWGNNAPKVVVYPTHHDIPSEVLDLAEEQFDPSGTKGWYVNGTVFLVASNLKDRVDTIKTLAHESVGHWGMTLQEDHDYQDIVSKIHALKRTDSYVKGVAEAVDRDYNNIDETTTAEEIIARIAEDMVTGNSVSDSVSNVWTRLIGAVRKFLRKIFPLQFTRRDIEAMLANSERALRSSLKSTRKENTNKPLFSSAENIENIDPEIARKRLQDVLDESGANAYDKVKGAIAGNKMVEAIKTGALKAVTLRQLGDLASKILPQINVYVDTVNKMLTRRNQMAEKAATIVEGWQEWAAKNRKVADKLHDLMHESTLAQVDPSEEYVDMTERFQERHDVVTQKLKDTSGDTGKVRGDLFAELKELKNDIAFEPQRKEKWEKLRPSWDALSPEAQKTYTKVREEYKDRHNKFKGILLNRVATAELNSQQKREMLAKLRYDFETQELMGPYFPLARFGRYWVSTTDEKGEKVYLTFESEVEQKRVKGNLEKEGYKTKHGQMLDSTMQQDSASLGFVNDVVKIIEGGNVGDETSFELSDAVYQLYLQSMPTRSMRHNFQHRKGVEGYSKNAIRAFADNMMKGAYQLARLEYQDDLSGQMEEMRKEASKAGDNKKGAFCNEMLKRHEWVMNPTNSVIAQKLTALGFVWMLGVSPAAAMVNLTQTFVVALPVIGARYGAVKTAKEMVKASRGFNIIDGAIDPKHLTQGERDAMQVWKDSGLIDGTRAHDLAGIAEHGGYNYSDVQEKVMRKVSWLFHRAEQFNREVTALSAYRLGIKKHGEGYHQEAIAEAEKLTWESHFDYGNTNRAPFMQSNAAKVALQFKQYSQNISYYLMRNLTVGFKKEGWSTSERKIARRQLLGSLGATALIGGANALPLWWLFGLANLMWDDEDEPFDAREEFFIYLVEATGSKYAADKIMNGAGGSGVSGRVSLDGLWVRDSNRDLEGENLWSFYAKQIAGPTLGGILPQWFEGARKVSNGQYGRAFENFTPVFARNLHKSWRYYDEGALNLKGDELKSREDFSYAQLFTQGIGFTDSGVINQYVENSAIKGAAEKIKKRRRWLITQYYMAWKDGDATDRKDVLKKIRRYNKHNPRFPVSAGTLSRSMKTRERYRRESLNGINVNKRLRYLADERDFVN